jgi:hypothetical protein
VGTTTAAVSPHGGGIKKKIATPPNIDPIMASRKTLKA